MILGGLAISAAFNKRWQAYSDGKRMTKNELHATIGPNSIDVTLASAIMRQVTPYKIDPYKTNNIDYVPDSMESIKLIPGNFILGVTQERFITDEPLYLKDSVVFGKHTSNPPVLFVQKYDGRSTMGRLGIASHVTAGFGDYGFKDYWTLEIVNLGQVSVVLHAGMRIGQISFEAVYEPTVYKGAYVEVSSKPMPKAPKLGKDRF